MRVPYVGGHFGSKGLTGSVLAALFLARKTGRPVKMTPSAEESFRQVSRHAMVYKAKIGVKKDGTVTALDVDMILDTGAYTTGGPTTTHIAVVAAWGCYRFPHFRCYAPLRIHEQGPGDPYPRYREGPDDLGYRVRYGQRGASAGNGSR